MDTYSISCIGRLLKSTCLLFIDPLTAVRYPSVTMVLSPDVTGVTELPWSRHSGGREEEAGAGRRQRRQSGAQAMAIMMTHSGAQGQHNGQTPGTPREPTLSAMVRTLILRLYHYNTTHCTACCQHNEQSILKSFVSNQLPMQV